jgi:hypothetical protein
MRCGRRRPRAVIGVASSAGPPCRAHRFHAHVFHAHVLKPGSEGHFSRSLFIESTERPTAKLAMFPKRTSGVDLRAGGPPPRHSTHSQRPPRDAPHRQPCKLGASMGQDASAVALPMARKVPAALIGVSTSDSKRWSTSERASLTGIASSPAVTCCGGSCSLRGCRGPARGRGDPAGHREGAAGARR